MANRVLNQVRVYLIKSQNNRIKGDSVYLDEKTAKDMKYNYEFSGCNVYLDSVVLPFAGKYVSFIDIYRGFDYGYPGMYDVVQTSELYPSVEFAKKDTIWQNLLKRVEKNNEEFNVYENRICSRECLGTDWFYGDVMEGKISAQIKKLRIVR